MITALAAAPEVSLIVGAGASAEAGLPAWSELVGALLERAARERLGLEAEAHRDAWIAEILRSESPLGAAAVAGPDRR
jgi:hypothetical protein